MTHRAPHPPSPCTNLCALDPHTDICAGCFRTLDEIATWSSMSAEDKHQVLASIPARRAAHERVPGARPD